MLIPTPAQAHHNGHDAQVLLDGLAGRPQLVGVLGLGSTSSAADIQKLQQALLKAGKSVRTDGVLDGNTLASTYEIIRDKGAAVGGAIAALASKSASSAVQSAFGDLQSLDSLLSQVPGISLSIPSLLRDTSTVDAVVSAAQTLCSVTNLGAACTIANKIKNSLNAFFSTMSDAVPTLTSVIGLLVPGSTSTTTLPAGKMLLPKISANLLNRLQLPGTYPAGTIYTASSKQPGMYRIGVPRAMTAGLGNALGSTAPYQEVTASATPPANATQVDESTFDKQTGTQPFYKKIWFWAAVGGGVLATGTIIALIVHRQRVHHRSAAFERALGDGEYDDHIDWDDEQDA
jgi:hypothetical protein